LQIQNWRTPSCISCLRLPVRFPCGCNTPSATHICQPRPGARLQSKIIKKKRVPGLRTCLASEASAHLRKAEHFSSRSHETPTMHARWAHQHPLESSPAPAGRKITSKKMNE
jgi:hypothetical protein